MLARAVDYLYYQVMESASAAPKHRLIREALENSITSGQYRPGERLPSEAEFVKMFGASRPTVIRALRELQLSGLIERRAGSGSYVRSEAAPHGHTFGLLIPNLGRTEIFEPICRGMAEAQQSGSHVLLWGSSLGDPENTEAQVAAVCRQFVVKKVSGVFFAPLELHPRQEAINRSIADTFDRAGIPIVLLDRDLDIYPSRSRYDLVGIDNRRVGYAITAHLLACGCRRVAFLGRSGSAPTVEARIAGYREALVAAGIDLNPGSICRLDPSRYEGDPKGPR